MWKSRTWGGRASIRRRRRNPQQFYPMMREMGVVPMDGHDAHHAPRRRDVGVASSRDLLVGFGRDRHRQRPAADPAPDRSAGSREVPSAPRSAVRAARDGETRSRGARAGDRTHRRLRRLRCVRVQLRGGDPVAVHGVPPADGSSARRSRSVPPLQGRHHPTRGRDHGRGTGHGSRDRPGDLRLLRAGHRRATTRNRRTIC